MLMGGVRTSVTLLELPSTKFWQSEIDSLVYPFRSTAVFVHAHVFGLRGSRDAEGTRPQFDRPAGSDIHPPTHTQRKIKIPKKHF